MEYLRVVEAQTPLYEYNVTTSTEHAEALQELIESEKPKKYAFEWHELIATPFRYHLPVGVKYGARFRPPGSKTNILYASEELRTALYEHAFHFCKFRIGMNPKTLDKSAERSVFGFNLITEPTIEDVSNRTDILKIMDKFDYKCSHEFIEANPLLKVIRYPSCRDTKAGHNIAVREIKQCEKDINSEKRISFVFDPKGWKISWIEPAIEINCKKEFAYLFQAKIQKKKSKPHRV